MNKELIQWAIKQEMEARNARARLKMLEAGK